ncbi:MAG TPA: hypothetical protein VGM27_10415, partial [Acidobacteriaceae bacterium]
VIANPGDFLNCRNAYFRSASIFDAPTVTCLCVEAVLHSYCPNATGTPGRIIPDPDQASSISNPIQETQNPLDELLACTRPVLDVMQLAHSTPAKALCLGRPVRN